MALLDFLKKKKEVEKSKKMGKIPPASGEKVFPAKESKTKELKEVKEEKVSRLKKEVKGFSYEIVKEPHISEKSTNLAKQNKYVFKIYSDVNKPEVKKAVEGIYGVDVLSVNVIKIPKKKRRLGRTEGFRKSYIKAIVTIKEGQKIEVY